MEFSLDQLNTFIVKAKAATYVGDGKKAESSRPGSHDLVFSTADFSYRDSYFGGADFIGEEVVYFKDKPVWAMNYYGRIIRPEKISAAQAGSVIKASLSRMYEEGRFLGGFKHTDREFEYTDSNDGGIRSFTGIETISLSAETVYILDYHGGLIK